MPHLSIPSVSCLLLGALLTCSGCGRACELITTGTSSEYQHDMDIARLQDLQTLGSYIESYHQRSGTYPFAQADAVPTYILIATAEQQPRGGGGPPQPHRTATVQALEAELERVLGVDVRIPFDPQRVASGGRPNFYIYMVRGNVYNLAVNVHSPFPFARRVGEHYHKVEISNAPNPAQRIVTLQQLLADLNYQAAVAEPLIRPARGQR